MLLSRRGAMLGATMVPLLGLTGCFFWTTAIDVVGALAGGLPALGKAVQADNNLNISPADRTKIGGITTALDQARSDISKEDHPTEQSLQSLYDNGNDLLKLLLPIPNLPPNVSSGMGAATALLPILAKDYCLSPVASAPAAAAMTQKDAISVLDDFAVRSS